MRNHNELWVMSTAASEPLVNAAVRSSAGQGGIQVLLYGTTRHTLSLYAVTTSPVLSSSPGPLRRSSIGDCNALCYPLLILISLIIAFIPSSITSFPIPIPIPIITIPIIPIITPIPSRCRECLCFVHFLFFCSYSTSFLTC